MTKHGSQRGRLLKQAPREVPLVRHRLDICVGTSMEPALFQLCKMTCPAPMTVRLPGLTRAVGRYPVACST
eukprot:6276749-Amphidinium_carterae.1